METIPRPLACLARFRRSCAVNDWGESDGGHRQQHQQPQVDAPGLENETRFLSPRGGQFLLDHLRFL